MSNIEFLSGMIDKGRGSQRGAGGKVLCEGSIDHKSRLRGEKGGRYRPGGGKKGWVFKNKPIGTMTR